MSSPVEPELATFLLLYDFAPFLSVAMAINFVSSFWDEVRNKAVNNLDIHRESFINELNVVYTSGDCQRSDSVVALDEEAETYKKFLTGLSLLATSLGVIIVLCLFVLLAWIGFYPKEQITENQALWMVAFSIVPSTLLRGWGAYYSRSAIKKLEKTSKTMKTAAKAAIRDNQQAAYSNM